MTLLRSLVLGFALIAVSVVTAEDKKPAAKFDAEKLVGDWKVTSGSKDGEKVGDDAKKGVVTFTKDKITVADGDMKFVFTYKVDGAADPVSIDMEITEPEGAKGMKAKGIVKFDGEKSEKLTLCYNPKGGDRPKKFDSTKENGNFIFMMDKKEAK